MARKGDPDLDGCNERSRNGCQEPANSRIPMIAPATCGAVWNVDEVGLSAKIALFSKAVP
jgi:hypothetical protein